MSENTIANVEPDLDQLAAQLMVALAAEPVPPAILALATQLQTALAARTKAKADVPQD